MKNLLILLLCISFVGCNPFISKELRIKKRANRKLERLVKKYPELLKQDTASIIYDTTIITSNPIIDTAISLQFDTITLEKDKLRLKLIKTTDTLLIDAECLPDTIRIKEFIKVPFNKVSTIELTTIEKVSNFISKFWWWCFIFLVLIVGGRITYKFLFK